MCPRLDEAVMLSQGDELRYSWSGGVSTVLLGQSKLEDSVQRTAVENLDILPCGPLPPNPSEILNSQAFLDMINVLCLKYDQIVIDSPPVEPVTDA